jgi:hypothetical protein
MLCTIVGAGLLGAIPVMRPLLFVALAAVVAMVAYLGLLVHLRTLAAEREVKLRYLPTPIEHEQSIVIRRAGVR